MEHADLVSEMAQVEHLTTQERLHLARRRRMQQLKIWQQREKEWARSRAKREKSTKRNIYFSDSVMLLEAAARNDIEEVRRLLSRGVTPDATNEDGLTALHQCCIDNNEGMMRLLLEHGADVNAEDSERWTPLHAAATCGNLNLVRILIARGANLLAVNGDGNMPYDICEEERTLDAIESEMAARGVTQRLIDETRAATEMTMLKDVAEMVRTGADLDEPRDNQGATLLHIASANGYLKAATLLLEHRAHSDVPDHDAWRPAHAAACWGHLEVLELLVQYGADLNVRNKHDETPADICEDGEMRARIVRLAAEQEESRRRAAAAAAAARHSGGGAGGGGGAERLRGARRSSSTASSNRVRSVRRTSLREKQLAAKADARGEARLRETFACAAHPDLQGYTNGVENDQNTANQLPGAGPQRLSTSSTNSNQSYDSGADYAALKHPFNFPDPTEQTYKNTNPLFGVNAASNYAPGADKYDLIPNGVRKAPEGQDNDGFNEKPIQDSVDGNDLIVNPNQIALSDGTATYTTDNNGKINVHVTVMINAGTLADLKKQRAQTRTNGNGSPVDVTPNQQSLTSAGEGLIEMPVQLNPLGLSPGAGAVPRFSGHTSDVVGDSRSRRCCVIM